MNNSNIYICATMNTKGDEAIYLKNEIEKLGNKAYIVDVSLRQADTKYQIDISASEVAEKAGVSYQTVLDTKLRSEASEYMIKGLTVIAKDLLKNNKLDGMISLGGSGGTTIATGVMHNLPIGLPKVVVGTMACGNTIPYVNGQDILLINSVVDIQSLNFMSKFILSQAAAIISGMTSGNKIIQKDKKCIGITCFGVTTPCVQRCVEILEENGYETLVFHARGISGGKIMEKMIEEDFFVGIMDITTTELIDEVAGGAYSIGPQRLTVAVKKGIPYLVVPGATDMINIGPVELLKPEQKDHIQYFHNNSSLLKLRATKDEAIKLANVFIDRLKDSKGNTKMFIPKKGFSEVDKEGGVFYSPEIDSAFTDVIISKMPSNVPVKVIDKHINEKEFADIITKEFLEMLKK